MVANIVTALQVDDLGDEQKRVEDQATTDSKEFSYIIGTGKGVQKREERLWEIS